MAKDKNVKIIYKKKYIEGDHEEHIDERWLVSYADMMTLLFGLFVMLYAMQDPEATKKMKESIQQKFAQDQVKDPKVNLPDYQAQIAALTAQLADQAKLIAEAADLKTKFTAMEDESKKLKEDLALQVSENTKSREELKRLETENQEKNRSIASIQNENKSTAELTREKVVAEEKLKKNENELLKKKDEIKAKDEEIAKMKEELARKVAAIDKIEKEKDKDKEKPKEKNFEKEYISESEKTKILDQKNKELEAKLQTLEQKGSFLAIVLNWFTNEHDLDLVIKDPNGKKFTFKNKEFLNYPGKIVLDSRRGPGAEIWQADKVIAGTYEAEITFYNQYGNPAPAEGKLVIFSTRGNIEIPDIKLDLNKNPKRKVLFEISQLGEIKLK
tara:strand:- start:17810 stop:18967 length:1158 start_codon:yes stop_codon:yes gene_type:complete